MSPFAQISKNNHNHHRNYNLSTSSCRNSSSELVLVLKSENMNKHNTHHHHTLCCPQMEFRFVTVALMTIMTMSTLLALCVTETEARPSRSTAVGLPDGWSEYYRILQVDQHRRSVNECETSPEVRGLCQRCAKVTKSKMAYPLCCEHRMDTRMFCINFLNFGLTNRNDLNNS